jgi:hypothetical protein
VKKLIFKKKRKKIIVICKNTYEMLNKRHIAIPSLSGFSILISPLPDMLNSTDPLAFPKYISLKK